MTQHDDFFQDRKPAAVLKHKLLAEYARVFVSMIGSRTGGPIWLIDGYAGAGAYEDDDGRPTDEGSPLVLLRTTTTLRNRDVRTIFIEADPTLAAKLVLNTEEFRQQGRQVTILTGDVHDRIAQAWAMVAGQPVVTFLDPFGVAMKRDTMCDVLLERGRGQPSEVLLNINLEAVRRIGGLLEHRDGTVVPREGQQKAVLRADAFLGGPWWRERFFESRLANNASAAVAAMEVIDEYRAQVGQLTGRQSLSIAVRRRPDHEPLFLLTLFFRHPAAGYKFADAASRATAAWRRVFLREDLDEVSNAAESLFGVDQDRAIVEREFNDQEERFAAEWIALIQANILTAGRPLRVGGDVREILGSTIGLAGDKHIRAAWDQLAVRGAVVRRNPGDLYKQVIRPATG